MDCEQSRVAQWWERCPVVSLQVVSQRLQFAAKRPVSLRALACHRGGLGSNPRSDSICKLSLLLVPTLAPRAILWFSLLFLKKKNIPSGQEKCNVHCTCLNWRYLLSKRGKQMGVHDSAVWKDVDALTKLKIRWRSTNKTKIKVNVNK